MKNNCRKTHSGKAMSRLLSLLLIAAMMLVVLAGCNSSTVEPSVEETPAAESESAAPAESTETEPTEEPDAEAQEPEVEEPAEDVVTISYPLPGDKTFTIFRAYESNILSGIMDDYTENDVYERINELTGVTLEFVSPSSSSATENYNLMIASEEYTDLLDCVGSYTGGILKAYEDEVIYDLTDYIDTCAPDYWRTIQEANEYTQKAVVTDDGRVLSFYGIMDEYIYDDGLLIRGDWVEGVGMEIPETADELFDVLLAIKDKYGPDKSIGVAASGNITGLVGAFGIPGISIAGNSSGAGDVGCFVMEDGVTIQSTLQSDGFRDYLEYMNKLYTNGLIDQEFYSNTGFGAYASDIAAGHHTVFQSKNDSIATLYSMTEDPNFKATPIKCIVGEKGDTYQFGGIPNQITDRKLSVSKNCDDVETAVKYLNWFFTDEAYLICNYGTEGKTFTYNEDNNPIYTDLITHNELLNAASVRFIYCFNSYVPIFYDNHALQNVADEEAQAALEVWKNIGSSQTMPTLTYTTEESNTRAAYTTDITTYISEICLSWILGETALDDASWDDFQATLVNMHIEDVVACEQSAFDRYMSK